jgi:hypothetical protein
MKLYHPILFSIHVEFLWGWKKENGHVAKRSSPAPQSKPMDHPVNLTKVEISKISTRAADPSESTCVSYLEMCRFWAKDMRKLWITRGVFASVWHFPNPNLNNHISNSTCRCWFDELRIFEIFQTEVFEFKFLKLQKIQKGSNGVHRILIRKKIKIR